MRRGWLAKPGHWGKRGLPPGIVVGDLSQKRPDVMACNQWVRSGIQDKNSCTHNFLENGVGKNDTGFLIKSERGGES